MFIVTHYSVSFIHLILILILIINVKEFFTFLITIFLTYIIFNPLFRKINNKKKRFE